MSNHFTISRALGALCSVALSLIIAVSFVSLTPVPSFADELSEAKAKLADASDKLETAKKEAEKALAEKKEADADVERVEEDIAEIEAEIPKQEEAAAKVVREMYQEGGDTGMVLSLIDCLLFADSFDDIIKSVEYWGAVKDYRADAIAQVKETKAELDKQRDELVKQQEKAKKAYKKSKAKIAEAQEAYEKAKSIADEVKARYSSGVNWSGTSPNGIVTLSQMKFRGVVHYAGYRYTYYSQSVLPGGGLSIPGRHVENGCVVDKDGYICVASSMHSKGTIVPTPLKEFPKGKVYDSGCAWGTLDLYVA